MAETPPARYSLHPRIYRRLIPAQPEMRIREE